MIVGIRTLKISPDLGEHVSIWYINCDPVRLDRVCHISDEMAVVSSHDGVFRWEVAILASEESAVARSAIGL